MTYAKTNLRRALLGGSALLSLASAPALAQTETSSGVLEEVVVTATRQEQVLSRVPVSVAAFTQESMDAVGVRQVDDIARLTPGLVFNRSNYGAGQQTDITIRGISGALGGSAATTGVYIDDTPIQVRGVGFTATNAFPKIFDLERVEVLRGPQGTLFGAGAMGGTVRFIAPEPDVNDRSVYARSEIAAIEGGQMSGEIGAAVGGPIVEDKIGFRISGWVRRDGGWIDRVGYPGGAVIDKNANTGGSTALRAAVKFQPTERLEIVPSFYYQKTTVDDTQVLWENLSNREEGRFRTGNQLPEWNRDFFSLGAVAVRYDFGAVSLESNSSLFVRKYASQWDYTDDIGSIFFGTPYPQLIAPGYQVRATMINRQKSFTQEVRLRSTDSEARLRWVAGVFYNHADQDSEQWDYDPMFPQMIETLYGAPVEVIFGPTARGDQPHDLVNINRGVDKQLAAFGQVDFEILEGLTLTGGLRISKNKFRSRTDQYGSAISETRAEGRQEESPITPKVGLSWQMNPRNLVYASAAKGFRLGGSNDPLNPIACGPDFQRLGITANPLTYDADTVWNYEVGSKNTLLDGRLQIAASAFQVDWSNIQRGVSLPSCFLGYTTNLGSARSRGFDFEARAIPIEGLTVNLSVGHTDAKYRDTISAVSGAAIVEAGDPLGGPKWVLAAGAEYEFAAFGQDAYVRGDYQYRGRPPGPNPNVTGYDPSLYRLKAQELAKLRVGVRMDRVDVSVFADNLFNATPILARSHGARTSPLFLIQTYQPRTIGVTAIARY